MPGKILQNSGEISFAMMLTIPPFSPIFIIPIHSVRTPVRYSEVSNPVLAMAKVEFIMSENTAVSPKKISFTRPVRNAMAKNAIQI